MRRAPCHAAFTPSYGINNILLRFHNGLPYLCGTLLRALFAPRG
jgi:hypothetical protein